MLSDSRTEGVFKQTFEEEGMVKLIVSMMDPSQEQKELRIKASVVIARMSLAPAKYVVQLMTNDVVVNLIASLESLTSPLEMKESIVYTLGNLLSEKETSPPTDVLEFRTHVLTETNIVPLLAELASHPSSTPVLRRTSLWTLSRVCESMNPIVSFKHIPSILQAIKILIFDVDVEVICDCCLCLSGLCRGDPKRVQLILESDLTGRIMALLTHANTRVASCALKVVGLIAAGTESQAQILLDLNILPILTEILLTPKKEATKSRAVSEDNFVRQDMKRHVCWILSNITVGTSTQVEAVKKSGLFPLVCRLMDSSADFRTRKEALFCIKNATFCGSIDQVRYLADEVGVIDPICRCLDYNDVRMTMTALTAIENILQCGHWIAKKKGRNHLNPYAVRVENSFGLEKIEMLQIRDNEDIVDKALGIISTFFPDKRDESQDNSVSSFWYHVSQAKQQSSRVPVKSPKNKLKGQKLRPDK